MGCYLLITYSHDIYDLNPRVGFEYTLLARIWDEEKIDSKIINIPFNEYIFGVFEEDSINYNSKISIFNFYTILKEFNAVSF